MASERASSEEKFLLESIRVRVDAGPVPIAVTALLRSAVMLLLSDTINGKKPDGATTSEKPQKEPRYAGKVPTHIRSIFKSVDFPGLTAGEIVTKVQEIKPDVHPGTVHSALTVMIRGGKIGTVGPPKRRRYFPKTPDNDLKFAAYMRGGGGEIP